MTYPLTSEANNLLNKIVKLDLIRPYTLIGGSALSIHIKHRLSEDLDFAEWKDNPSKRLSINTTVLYSELQNEFRTVDIVNALDNQLDLVIDDVKVTFFIDNENRSPGNIQKIGQLKIADLRAIAAMKIGLLFDRVKFRDYYDLYAIHQSGLPLSVMVDAALEFKPYLNKKLIYIALTDSNRTVDEDIEYLKPKYKLTKTEIRQYFTDLIIADKSK